LWFALANVTLQAFQFGVAKHFKLGGQATIELLQPLRWCYIECVIHHERDVRVEQHHIDAARTSNNRVIAAHELY